MALPTQRESWPRRVVRNPHVLGGEPTLEGTRISVRTVVEALRYNDTIEDVLRGYPMLDRQAIERALDFYRRHQDEIDRYILENQDSQE
ncbi:MAG: DUF433 domain-containing protein [Chloroflexota bacterium]